MGSPPPPSLSRNKYIKIFKKQIYLCDWQGSHKVVPIIFLCPRNREELVIYRVGLTALGFREKPKSEFKVSVTTSSPDSGSHKNEEVSPSTPIDRQPEHREGKDPPAEYTGGVQDCSTHPHTEERYNFSQMPQPGVLVQET